MLPQPPGPLTLFRPQPSFAVCPQQSPRQPGCTGLAPSAGAASAPPPGAQEALTNISCMNECVYEHFHYMLLFKETTNYGHDDF